MRQNIHYNTLINIYVFIVIHLRPMIQKPCSCLVNSLFKVFCCENTISEMFVDISSKTRLRILTKVEKKQEIELGHL